MTTFTHTLATHAIRPLHMLDAMDVVFAMADHFGMQAKYDPGAWAGSEDISFSVEVGRFEDDYTADDMAGGRTYKVRIVNHTLSDEEVAAAIPEEFRHLLNAL